MSYPFCFNSFARSPISIDVSLADTDLANKANGCICAFSASKAFLASLSSFNALNAAIAISGLSSSSSLAYKPCLRIDGRTSEVTHLLNAFAFGSLLDKMREYNPLSLISHPPLCPNSRSKLDSVLLLSLSSSSTCSCTASFGLLYPNTSATSLPTNQGALLISIVRTSPNASFLKIFSSFKLLPPLF